MRSLTPNLIRKLSLASLTASLLSISADPASADVITWNGAFNGTDLAAGGNWSTNTVPSPAIPDTAQWDGTAIGDLALTLNGSALAGSAGNAGLTLNFTAAQTSAVTISAVTDSSIRVGALNIDAGAGPVSFGATGAKLILNLGGSGGTTQTLTNNSSNAVTFGTSAAFNLGGGGFHNVYFSGSGDWTFNNALIIAAEPTLYFNGTGTTTLNGANGSFNQGTYIGAGQSATTVRVTATQALGASAVRVGEGGNGSTARLELTGTIGLTNAVTLYQRTNASASIENVGGNNTLSGAITLDVGGTQARIQSDAGLLTLSGSIAAANGVASTRNLYLQGAGDGAVTGVIRDGTTQKLTVTKDGTGTWTLSGLNTYTGNTTVNDGTLALSSTGQLTFTIGLAGVNNQILGIGNSTAFVTLDGVFVFNLTGASTTIGDSWEIIDYDTSVNTSFGSNFSVQDFQTVDNVIWTSADGLYQFDKSTGLLTVVPEPRTFALLACSIVALLFFRRRQKAWA